MEKKGDSKYECLKCNFFAKDKSHYTRHLETKKHNKVKNNINFECKKCNFTTFDKYNYNKHLNSKKHQEECINYKNICDCGKKYKYKQSLIRHQETCDYIKEENTKEENIKETELEIIVSHLMEQKELVKKLCNQLEQQNSKIEQLQKMKPPPITNNNNNTNILLILNERFSDTISLTDFINNMIITCDHLLYTGKNGREKGIVNILMDNMKDLQQCQRPICTNKDNLFIKGEEQWMKDKDEEEIKKAAQSIQHKQIKNLNLYPEKNPNWNEIEHQQIEYMTALSKVMGEIDNKKVVREIKKNKNELNVISKI